MAVNRARSRHELEYELVDTGVFDDDRYFDVEVEYAKAGPKDILCRSPCTTAPRRTPRCTCCRRCGSATRGRGATGEPKPRLARVDAAEPVVRAEHPELGVFYLTPSPEADLLFCENETNPARMYGAEPTTRFAKDGIGDHVLHGADTVNPDGEGRRRRRMSV